MNKKKITLSVAVACALALGMNQADTYANEVENDTLLDSIVITATRTPVAAKEANANISVVTAEDIAKNHYTTVTEALRSVPGVYIAENAPAGYEASSAFRINGASEVVVMIDGVKVSSSEQRFLLSTYRDMENIERIEVLKGSASVLYGSEAKGGVVNIITKKINENHTTFAASAGSFDRRQYSFSTRGQENGWTYRVLAQKDKSGDFKDGHGTKVANGLDASTISFKLSKELSDKHEIGFSYDKYLADTKSKALWEQYVHDGTYDNYNWRITLQSDFDDTTSNFFAFSDNIYDATLDYEFWYDGATLVGNSWTKVKTMRITDQFTKELSDRHRITTGFEYTKDEVVSSGNKKMYNRAVFLQNEWHLTDALKLTNAFRYDNNSGFGDHTTPSVNLGYQISDATNIYVGYNEYFVAPTAYQLYDAYYGNQSLKEETGKTKEIGINHQFDDTFSASAHLFWRDSEDRIGYVAQGMGGQYQNVGDEKAHGWDVSLNKKFSDTVSAYVGYTHTTVDATAEYSANADGNIPKGAWNLGVDYSENKWDVSLQGRGVIDRYGDAGYNAPAAAFPCDTYWIWDIGINYKPSQDVKVFAKVNNLFDKFYAEVSNVGWGGPNQWYTAPGRNVLMGVEYSF